MAKAYKLLEQNPEGKLFPLFINNKTETPIGVWIKAESHPTKGFSCRPGWHVGKLCSAPWLMGKDGTYKSSHGKKWKRVWCEVEYNDNNDYTELVQDMPGKCMKDQVPEDGFYKFKEKGRCTWIITSAMKVVRILPEDERLSILKKLEYDEIAGFEPYKKAFEKRDQTLANK